MPVSIAATLNTEGCEEPFASGGTAVCRLRTPSCKASIYTSGARPVVQCECSSTGTPFAFSRMTGSSVRARSAVNSPPWSLT